MAQLVQLFQKYSDNSEAGFHSHIWHFEYLIEFFYIQVRFLTDNISELLFPYLVWFWWDFARLPQVVKLYLCTTRLLNGSVQGSAVSAALGSWIQFLLIILCNSSSVQFFTIWLLPCQCQTFKFIKVTICTHSHAPTTTNSLRPDDNENDDYNNAQWPATTAVSNCSQDEY